MWTFPTVRPSSINKLQRDLNHLDNKVNMSFKSLSCITNTKAASIDTIKAVFKQTI